MVQIQLFESIQESLHFDPNGAGRDPVPSRDVPSGKQGKHWYRLSRILYRRPLCRRSLCPFDHRRPRRLHYSDPRATHQGLGKAKTPVTFRHILKRHLLDNAANKTLAYSLQSVCLLNHCSYARDHFIGNNCLVHSRSTHDMTEPEDTGPAVDIKPCLTAILALAAKVPISSVVVGC